MNADLSQLGKIGFDGCFYFSICFSAIGASPFIRLR